MHLLIHYNCGCYCGVIRSFDLSRDRGGCRILQLRLLGSLINLLYIGSFPGNSEWKKMYCWSIKNIFGGTSILRRSLLSLTYSIFDSFFKTGFTAERYPHLTSGTIRKHIQECSLSRSFIPDRFLHNTMFCFVFFRIFSCCVFCVTTLLTSTLLGVSV